MDTNETFLNAVKSNEGFIFKIASVYTNDAEDAADLAQEIVYQLWKSFGTYNQKASLSTWMYRVAMNVAIYHLKSAKRKVPTIAIGDHHLNLQTIDNTDDERWKLLKQNIDRLNLFEKSIVILYLEEKSHEEIAAIVGISISNVGTKLSRIKEKLKQQITKQL